MIEAVGVKDALDIGLLTAIPYGCARLAMLATAKSADTTSERRWHFTVASALGSLGLLLATIYDDNVTLAMAALSLGTAGLLATMPAFLTYPNSILSGTAAAAGIAMINSTGNLAGFVSPSIIGWMKDITQSTNAGMYVMSDALLLGSVLAVLQQRSLVHR